MPSIQENICGYTIYSPYLLAGCMIEHVNTTAQEWLRNKLYILGQRQGPKLPIQESGQSSKSSAAFLRDRAVGERPASSSPRLPDQRKAPQSGLNRGDSPPARINPNMEATERIKLSGGLIQIEFPRGQRPKMVMDRGSQSVVGSSRPRRSQSYHT
jgi:hypothetical protein